MDDGSQYRRVVPMISDLSSNGQYTENMVRSAVDGMGRALPDGECVTIILRVLRDVLDRY